MLLNDYELILKPAGHKSRNNWP